MSLLMNFSDQRYVKITQMVFEEQFRRDSKLDSEMDERRKRLMYDDVVYNISFLMTAVYFEDKRIFEIYAVWLYELLCHLMKDLDRYRIMEQMRDHYHILAEMLSSHGAGLLSEEEMKKAAEYLRLAAKVTEAAVTDVELSPAFLDGRHADIRKAYLDALLSNQTRQAYDIIRDARKRGIHVEEIYEDVLKRVMYEIGSLWHRHVITVDREHYATSVTQTVMSTFYEEIFDRPRCGRTLLSCAVGSELHEMGARMLSDLFEYYGWDSVYLGSALPEDSILEAIGEHKPDVVALSVTMVPYLADCEKIVMSIRHRFPWVKIAVGGQAFASTQDLWTKWDIDFYSASAVDMVHWAQQEPIRAQA